MPIGDRTSTSTPPSMAAPRSWTCTRCYCPGTASRAEVHYSYSNGDFPIQVNGCGTLVGHLVRNAHVAGQ